MKHFWAIVCLNLTVSLACAQTENNIRDTVFVMNDATNKVDTVIYVPDRITYYLNGTQVPQRLVFELAHKGKIATTQGSVGGKDAIRRYGEKYRYGVIFITVDE
jgi:hypothetical protein